MIKLSQSDFDELAERIGNELHDRYNTPLKPAKLRELIAHGLGYDDYNTFRGIATPPASETPSLLACLRNAELCRFTTQGDGLLRYVSYSDEPEDSEEGLPGGITVYLDHVEGREDAITLFEEDLAKYTHRRNNVWISPEGELLELFSLAPVTTG